MHVQNTQFSGTYTMLQGSLMNCLGDRERDLVLKIDRPPEAALSRILQKRIIK